MDGPRGRCRSGTASATILRRRLLKRCLLLSWQKARTLTVWPTNSHGHSHSNSNNSNRASPSLTRLTWTTLTQTTTCTTRSQELTRRRRSVSTAEAQSSARPPSRPLQRVSGASQLARGSSIPVRCQRSSRRRTVADCKSLVWRKRPVRCTQLSSCFGCSRANTLSPMILTSSQTAPSALRTRLTTHTTRARPRKHCVASTRTEQPCLHAPSPPSGR